MDLEKSELDELAAVVEGSHYTGLSHQPDNFDGARHVRLINYEPPSESKRKPPSREKPPQ